MSLKNAVIEGCTLVADSGTGTLKITSNASQNTKVDGFGVYAGTITISISNLTGAGFSGGTGSGTITGSAQYNKIDNQPVVLEGDKTAEIPVSAVDGDGDPITVPTVVTITVAGQTVVKME